LQLVVIFDDGVQRGLFGRSANFVGAKSVGVIDIFDGVAPLIAVEVDFVDLAQKSIFNGSLTVVTARVVGTGHDFGVKRSFLPLFQVKESITFVIN
jgi:hypothetical protein